MVTIKDVARLSGVSISTVSRVINSSRPVSPAVRKRVQEIIDETGYKPNDIARSLVTKKSYLIGVIINDLAQSYVADIVRGIEEIGKMYGYDILLCCSYFSTDAQEKYLQLLNRKQADGIFMVGYSFDDEITELAKSMKKPCVYFTKQIKDDMKHIAIDNSDAIYEATKYIFSTGNKKVAFMSDYAERSTAESDKINGFERAIEENGLNPKDAKIFLADGRRYKNAYGVGEEILAEVKNLDAIICSSDELAIGVMNYLQDNGLKVPDDISIMGMGNIKECEYVRPSLTTIGEPFYDYGAVGMSMLIKTIKGEADAKSFVELPFTIEKRNSIKIK